ncbi:MAG: ATP-binding protein [Sphingobacterium sp.]|uniref:ATP-binding protein n=1 Tax=Sphingobacterium sp. JB170 TaxID=1434842 RepID=UPI00097F3B31|nr:ATP-binding protein [Sphingobacterium sp. JB170]SJN21006.1 ATPase component BioM of energizing module of biotin ECF transporter [Sphingobacterium sp. JB170]
MKLIERPIYTNRIIPFIDKQVIKVLTGQRRVGKSYVMMQLMNHIRTTVADANIIYINMEMEDFIPIISNIELNEYLKDKWIEGKPNYLFIDEVQEIASFERSLRSLLAKNTCDIYCTGSNANMLSGELATHLSGRYVTFHIHSLNYQEFLQFHGLENSFESMLKYLKYGGMPFLANLGLEDDTPFEYLRNVYSTILLKDVVARENIRNISFLENLVAYLADNIGSLFSASNISKYLKSQKVDITPQLTINYLRALANAYFVHKVVRSEIGGLKIFEIGEKYYFEDTGLRNSIVGFNQRADLHKLLENVVYVHLLHQGYTVFVGKLGNREIDFTGDKNGVKIYVQVCLTLYHEETIEREFGNLKQIEDNYPKYVVTFNDAILGENHGGILQKNLIDFLMMDV